MKNIFFFLFASFLIIMSCSTDPNLQTSFYVPDKAHPGLPIYSEWGYNTFGALYNGKPFSSYEFIQERVPVVASDTNVSFTFKGSKSNYDDVIIILKISSLNIKTYADLVSLDKASLNLQDAAYHISIIDDFGQYEAQILSGSFEFKRAQNLLVDKEQQEAILSGTFSFEAIINGKNVSVTDGRFDIDVGDDNFTR